MAPRSNPQVDAAVRMVIKDGVQPRTAWEMNGKPNGEPGIQNIRKRAREAKAKAEAAAAPPAKGRKRVAQGVPPPAPTPAQPQGPTDCNGRRAKTRSATGRG